MPFIPTLGYEYPSTNDVAYQDTFGTVINNLFLSFGSEFILSTTARNGNDKLVSKQILKDYGEELSSPSISSNVLTLNVENGNHFAVSLDANVTTLTLSNPTASGDLCAITVWLKQDGTGGRTVAWPASIKWAGGTAPTVTSTANRTDIFVFMTKDGGTSWAGSIVGQNFAGL